MIKPNFPDYKQTSVSLNIFLVTSVQKLEQLQLLLRAAFPVAKPTVAFLNQLSLPRLRLGVRSTIKPSLPWHIPTSPPLLSLALLAQALSHRATCFSSPHLVSRQGIWLENHDPVFPFYLAKAILPQIWGYPEKGKLGESGWCLPACR